jgi:hypothetical protein
MFKVIIFFVFLLAVLSFRVSGLPDSKKSSRKPAFVVIILLLLLTGAIFYFLKMLKFAVIFWLALMILFIAGFYLR